MSTNFNIPVLFRLGTKANKGLLQPSNLISVLEASKKSGVCVKRNDKGHSYWMWSLTQATYVEANKYPGFDSWNEFHNIDIDLKDLFCQLGFINCNRNKSCPEIIDFNQFNDTMNKIKQILDKCLQQFFHVAFVTGSRCGFNYVCRVRLIDESDSEMDLKNEEMYNYSFDFLIDILKKNLKRFATECPDESIKVLAKLLLENEKAIDETAGQLNRMKFCGASEFWTNELIEKFTDNISRAPFDKNKFKNKFKEKTNSRCESQLRGIFNNIDCSKIDWSWNTRLAIGYSAPAVFGSKEKALEWALSLNIPENEEKDRKNHLISIIKSWKPSNYKTKTGEELIKKLMADDPNLLEKNLEKEPNKLKNELKLEINKYLSEETTQIYSLCEKFQKIGVCAPTGFGKTRMIIDLAKIYNKNGKRIVFLVPLNSIRNDAWNDVQTEALDNKKTLFRSLAGDYNLTTNWTYVSAAQNDRKNYNPFTDYNKNIVAVYDSGVNKVIKNVDPENTVLVVDESHSIVTTGYRSEIMPKMFELISEWTSNLILLSATPNYEFTKINFTINASRKNDIIRNAALIPYIAKDDFSIIETIVEQRNKEHNLVIYFDFANKKLVADVKKVCKENEGFNLYAKPETTQVDEIRKNGWIKNCKVLFISAFGAAGINLYPTNMTDIVCLTEDAGTSIQSCSRVRNYDKIASIKLYAKSDVNKFIHKSLKDYWNGLARNYSELAEIYDVFNELFLDLQPTFNDRIFYKDPEKTKFNDFVDAISQQNTEFEYFKKYAKANNINLTLQPEETFGKINGRKRNKMEKQMLFNQMNDEDFDQLRDKFSINTIKLLKRVRSNFIETGYFKELFDALPDKFAPQILKDYTRIIRLSCRSDYWPILIYYLADSFEKSYSYNKWQTNDWNLIQNWMNLVLNKHQKDKTFVQNYNKRFEEQLFGLKQFALFVIKYYDRFQQAFNIRFKLEQKLEREQKQIQNDINLIELLGLNNIVNYTENYDIVDEIAYGEYLRPTDKDITMFNNLIRWNIDQNGKLIDRLMLNEEPKENTTEELEPDIKKIWNELGAEWEAKQNKLSKSAAGKIGGKIGGKAPKKGTGTGKASKNFKTYLCVEDYSYKKGGKSLKEFNAFKGKTYVLKDITNKGISKPTALKIIKSEHFEELTKLTK